MAAPEQSLPFSHKANAGDTGETGAIPAAATCMQCHSTVKTGSPAIQKVTVYFNNKRPVPRVRVYEVLDYVNCNQPRESRQYLRGLSRQSRGERPTGA